LLFTLRKVDQQELIAKAGSDLSKKRKGPAGAKVLASDDLSEIFGIEMAPATPRKRAASITPATKSSIEVHSKAPKPAKAIRPAKPIRSSPDRRDGTQRLTLAKRRAISERMRKYWAAWREKKKKTSKS